jgi:hypothetical protein
VKKCLKHAEEILQKQRKAEEEFLKILRKFDPEKPEESFKKLWVSEKVYYKHLKAKIDDGDVTNWRDYLEKTFKTLAEFTSSYYEAYSLSWDRIYYDRKRQWMVVLTENGRIISSMKVKESLKETFERHLRSAEASRQKLKIYRGKSNEKFKAEIKRRLEILSYKK